MRTEIVFLIGCFLISLSTSFACTDFQIKAMDGSVVIGRTFEFGIDFHPQIAVYSRGTSEVSIDEKGQKGISWTSQYGYLGVNAFNMTNAVLDGINEKGLSAEALEFSRSEFQESNSGNFIVENDLPRWILGNFATVEEVKAAISKINVTSPFYVPEMHMSPSTHIAVHDALGNNIVIEFIDGKQKIYDNPIGVMTNEPAFDWHLANLRNYLNLENYNQKPETLDGVTVEPTGDGSGWLGLPGDATPPSRFVKVALFVHKASQPENVTEAINFANHIIYSVDIPKGLMLEEVAPNITLSDHTEWVLMKDLTNRVLYYRCYTDGTLRMIDMKGLAFAKEAPSKSVPLDNPATILDVTEELQPTMSASEG
jgi:choloylglycine hydrolase